MKRAQFEIMGLAIIVILVSLMIFFALMWGLQEQEDLTGQFLEEQFAQNVIDAIQKTSLTECRGTVLDYIYSQGADMPLTAMGNIQDPDCTTDQELDNIADAVRDFIANYQGREFYFAIRDQSCDTFDKNCGDIFVDRGDCDIQGDVGRPGRQRVSLYPQSGALEMILWVC